jgi:tetratricopeptide (TPR) repeat protein
MKGLAHRAAAVSDRGLRRMMTVGLLVLALGVPAFGLFYYRDQHVDPGPSLIDRQVASAENAVRKAPADIGLRLQLAAAYQSAGRLDAALTQYDETLKVQDANRTALLGRGDILVAKKDYAGAGKAYATIVKESGGEEFAQADPQLEKAHFKLGEIALKQGHPKAAVASLTSAVRIEPTDADALYLLGTAQLEAGAAKQAIASLHQAVAFVPTGWCEPYGKLSQAYRALGQAPQSSYATAMVAFCRGDSAAAKQRLAGLTTGSVRIDAMLGLGMIAEADDDRGVAAGWYRKVVALDKDNFSATTGLSRLGAGSVGS